MPLSLHASFVPSCRQILQGLSGLVDRAERHAVEHDLAPDALLAARLAPDMIPFAGQIGQACAHSAGAIAGVRQGVFSPRLKPPEAGFNALREQIAGAVAALDAVDPAWMEDMIGRDMRFEVGERRIPFVAEAFLLSFSQPNFYFHATTAYDILRKEGVALGKRDFLGALRIRQAPPA